MNRLTIVLDAVICNRSFLFCKENNQRFPSCHWFTELFIQLCFSLERNVNNVGDSKMTCLWIPCASVYWNRMLIKLIYQRCNKMISYNKHCSIKWYIHMKDLFILRSSCNPQSEILRTNSNQCFIYDKFVNIFSIVWHILWFVFLYPFPNWYMAIFHKLVQCFRSISIIETIKKI